MKPSIGRIVLFTSRRTSHTGPAVGGIIEMQPAIIVGIHRVEAPALIDEEYGFLVDLRIFGDDEGPLRYERNVKWNSKPGHELAVGRWSWVPET